MIASNATPSVYVPRTAWLGTLLLAAVAVGCSGVSEMPTEPTESTESNLILESKGRSGGIVLHKESPAPFGVAMATFVEVPSNVYAVEKINESCKVSLNIAYATGTPKSAGTIRVFHQNGSLLATLEPQPNGAYVPLPVMGPALWADGEKLTVRAEGAAGGVPAFQGKTTGVAGIEVTSPTAGEGGSLALSRTADLPVSWTGGGKAGVVSVTVSDAPPPSPDPVDPNARFTTIECEFEPSAHQGIVPARALGFLRTGTGYVQIFPTDRLDKRAGDWQVMIASASTQTTLPIVTQ